MSPVHKSATKKWRYTDMMEKNSTHYINGYQIVVAPGNSGLEVEINTGHTCYRAVCPSGAREVKAKRNHCSMAIAEPLVSVQMIEAMNEAIAQRQRVKV